MFKCRQEEGGAGRRELELPEASPRQLTSGLQGLNSWGIGCLPVTCDPAWAACPLPVKPQVTDAPCSLVCHLSPLRCLPLLTGRDQLWQIRRAVASILYGLAGGTHIVNP